jgi:hypothetical protein
MKNWNVVAEWLTLLLRFREVPGPNLGPETGYTDRIFVVFSLPPDKYRDSALKQATTASFKAFPTHDSRYTV